MLWINPHSLSTDRNFPQDPLLPPRLWWEMFTSPVGLRLVWVLHHNLIPSSSNDAHPLLYSVSFAHDFVSAPLPTSRRRWSWKKVQVLVSLLCPTLCSCMDCSPPGFSVQWFPKQNTGVGCHSLLQGGLPNAGIKPGSPALQADSLPSESQTEVRWRQCVFTGFMLPPEGFLLLLFLSLCDTGRDRLFTWANHVLIPEQVLLQGKFHKSVYRVISFLCVFELLLHRQQGGIKKGDLWNERCWWYLDK